MTFYEIDVFCAGESKYAWASGYGPIAASIRDIPFLREAPEIFIERRQKSWDIGYSPPGIKFDSGGTEWPDVLGCGQGTPFFFFSERILIGLRDVGISYLRATEMPLIHPFPAKLRDRPPPIYYVLECAPGLEVAWAAMGIAHDKDNQIDYSQGRPKPWPPAEWKVSISSWAGLDLMSYRNWQMAMTLVCTDTLKKLAEEKGWTNIRFRALATVD